MGSLKEWYYEFRADPGEGINKALGFVGKLVQKFLATKAEMQNTTETEDGEELSERIKQIKMEDPELHIGRVEFASSLRTESEVNPYVHDFAMACVRRHRSYDWGDSSEEQKNNNEHALIDSSEIIESTYNIPKECGLGDGYPEQITVKTNRQENETVVSFHGEDD